MLVEWSGMNNLSREMLPVPVKNKISCLLWLVWALKHDNYIWSILVCRKELLALLDESLDQEENKWMGCKTKIMFCILYDMIVSYDEINNSFPLNNKLNAFQIVVH